MKILKILMAVAIVASLFLFIRATDMQQVMASMRQVGYRFGLLILVTSLAALFATIGWKFCMGAPGKRLRLWDLFFIRVIGEAVGLVNPTSVVGGDAMKVFLLRNKDIEQTTVVASVFISRVIMVTTQLFLLVVAAFLLVYLGGFSLQFPDLPIGIYAILLGSVLVTIFLFRNGWVRKIVRQSGPGAALARRTAALRQQVREVRLELRTFYKNDKKALALASLFFTLHWVLGGLEFYFILLFLGVKATVTQGILVDMGVVFFKAAGAFVPAQIGVEEYGNKVMLATIGLPGTEIWVAASILRRARQLFWIAFGLVAYFGIYKKWGSVLRQS